MAANGGHTRRSIITGSAGRKPEQVHISSAIVSVLPAHQEHVVRLLSELPDVEVHHQTATKIVIVLEAADSGVLGARLIDISSMQGVLSANMVFEQRLPLANSGE